MANIDLAQKRIPEIHNFSWRLRDLQLRPLLGALGGGSLRDCLRGLLRSRNRPRIFRKLSLRFSGRDESQVSGAISFGLFGAIRGFLCAIANSGANGPHSTVDCIRCSRGNNYSSDVFTFALDYASGLARNRRRHQSLIFN